MVTRVRRLFDIRRGELLPVAFSFAYVGVVVAALLLAKPIRNGLFLQNYGPYALVYAYASVPAVLTIVVPLAGRLAARIGQRAMIVATLWFFCGNVILFWALFRYAAIWILPGVFYVWVNCFAVIAPVQAWSFTSTLFDTRQARRLFGLVGAGASLGGITGGALGRFLVVPIGGAVNLLLVLAALIAAAALVVSMAVRRMPRRTARFSRAGMPAVARPAAGRRPSFREALKTIAASPYLRLITAVVLLVAIATQWVGFQFSIQANARFEGHADRLTAFFSAFNLYTGLAAFALQLLVTGPVLRRFGMTLSILLLPIALLAGSAWIVLAPAFWPVLVTAGADQALRFSIDKASYELLYVPFAGRQRAQLKAAIDMIANRIADAAGGVLLGIATGGFLGLGGFHLGVRGTAAINVVFLGLWVMVAWRLRAQYVAAIGESIRTHRLEAERVAAAAVERSAAAVVGAKLESSDEEQVGYALDVLEAQREVRPHPSLRKLLGHHSPDVRRRAMRLINESSDRSASTEAARLVRDPDLEARAEALLYLTRHARVDPIAVMRDLDDFPEYSIRASLAAFLAAPGRTQNVEAARLIVRAMIEDTGPEAARVRREAARLTELRADAFRAELPALLALEEEDPDVLRYAARAAGHAGAADLAPLLIPRLADDAVAADVAAALAEIGEPVLPYVREALADPRLPLDAKRELPVVLARVGTTAAEQLLVGALLQGDAALRYRIISSLNKLRQIRSGPFVGRAAIELVLAAEITGHYRSYQVLAALRPSEANEPIVRGLTHAMEHELERIFRLMALVRPDLDLHSAYVGVNAADPLVRANAIEFLESSLEPELARLLLPLVDPHVSAVERASLADRIVGAEIDSTDDAIRTLLASDDVWLRETARAARDRLWRPREEAPADAEAPTEGAALAPGI